MSKKVQVARVVKVITQSSETQAMVQAEINGRMCTKHIHRDKSGEWLYCASQMPGLEPGDPPIRSLAHIEM